MDTTGQNIHIGRTRSVYDDSPGECCEVGATLGKDECRRSATTGASVGSFWRKDFVILLPRATGTIFHPAAGVVAGFPR